MSQSLKHTTIQTVVVSQITASLVLTAVYRLSNIPRQITFWEIIIIQFVCSSKSNQIKSLLLSHHHSTSALVSEILMSVLQTVQKKQQTIYLWTDSAKKQQTIYLWTDSAKKLHWSIYSAPDSAKKNNSNLHMDRQCKKNNSNLHMDRQCKKQQQFTYGQYIFTDCTEDNVQNTHTYTQYA